MRSTVALQGSAASAEGGKLLSLLLPVSSPFCGFSDDRVIKHWQRHVTAYGCSGVSVIIDVLIVAVIVF